MLKPGLCDYSSARLETITIFGAEVPILADERNKNSAPYTDGISEINNTQVYNAKDSNVVMPIYNLINQRDNYL